MVTSVFTAPAETCFGHTGRVFGLAYHPSSHQVLASASEDETVRVWSRSTPSGSWQQTSCCRGHSAEVLRVAWSPDGEILASGSADHTVRLWQVGAEGSHSYSGVELAVLSGHPEEVYGLKFIGISTAGSTTAAAAAATAQQQHAGQPSAQQFSSSSSDGGVSNTLVTASGESLFLWDLATGRMLQECAPVPLTCLAGLTVNGGSRSSQRRKDANGSSRQQQAVAAAGGSRPPAGQRAAAVQQQQQQRTEQHDSANALQETEQQQQQQQQQQPDAFLGPDETEDDNNEDEQEEESDEEPSGPPMLSYIFSLAAAKGTAWLAGSCADGMLRLWDAGQGALQEVAAVQVHVGDMGSVCSFVPQQPWLVLTISKSGQLVLQDIRLLGQALLAQQLQGPVYDMAWTMQQQQQQQQQQDPQVVPGTAAAAAAACGGGGGDGGAGAGLQLCVVGRDSCVRQYAFSREALLAGHLSEPQQQAMPEAYSGRLLALAATADGSALAAAGEAVPASTLRPARPQQQQQQDASAGLSNAGDGLGFKPAASSAAVPAETATGAAVTAQQASGAAVAAAAAAPAVVSRRRKGRSARPAAGAAAGAAVDLFNMTDDAGADDADAAQMQQQRQQQKQQHQSLAVGQQQAAAGSSSSTQQGSVAQPENAASASAATAAAAVAAAAEEVQLPACAAAAAGILMRAPLFTWSAS
uniref:Uncharacterized protein n=1 Tax=Tetradesmus obliquus TaxID=3088 RepID=A0A383VFN3_TETOB|eukprot:jgi/Sobl393_1/14255/SZX63743.1